jgi:hypothetical protein
MTMIEILSLLLALSAALHVGCAATITAWRGGTRLAQALLIGSSATGTTIALYLAAIAAYR